MGDGAGRWDGEGGAGRAEEFGVTAGCRRALARSASSRSSRLDPCGRRALTRGLGEVGGRQPEKCDRRLRTNRGPKILG